MSKKIKTWLIIAVSLMLVGGIIFVGVMSVLKWDFMELNTTKYETNTYEINDNFTNVSINTDTADVLFLESSDGKCKIECFERQKEKHTVTVQDNTLKINVNDTRKWYDYITFFSFGTPKIKVYLPQDKYDTLTINLSTGDIQIPKDFTFEDVDIKGSTGNVTFKGSTTNNLKIKISTGHINIQDITAGNVNLTTSTGDINVKSMHCSGNFETNVSTGKVHLADVNCEKLISDGNTGDMKLTDVIATNNFNITSSTGDIKLVRCDASELYITTDTGNVSGNLLTDKVFICQTDTGSVNVPKTTKGGKCEITTDTGDIKLEITK